MMCRAGQLPNVYGVSCPRLLNGVLRPISTIVNEITFPIPADKSSQSPVGKLRCTTENTVSTDTGSVCSALKFSRQGNKRRRNKGSCCPAVSNLPYFEMCGSLISRFPVLYENLLKIRFSCRCWSYVCIGNFSNPYVTKPEFVAVVL